ncbi:hypothetical protein BDD12DRAFT_782634 [Trichophaea hybrida]|nr:hypothetical protein BDD12DRAFT_782634 [Trichophaea hybrida]
MVPYSRNRLFTGRKSAVEEIEGLASDVGHRRIALYGLGGVGKTQIALECAYRRRGKCHVFWVHASGHAKFSQDYKKISEHVGLQSSDKEEEILAKVKDWFQSAASGEWLLLLDNADDLSDFAGNDSSLSRYIPRGSKGAVIITTRSRQLFSQRCPQYKSAQDAEAVSKLLESLDYCPLAVVGATSFMIQMNTSPSEYLELLNSTQQARQELPLTQFNDAHREVLEICGSDMTERVLSTYYTTFKQIEKQLPLAADFLRLIAFLDRQGIQQELLAASKLDDVDNKLVDFSLVTWAEGGTMLALHRLVHLSIKTYLSQQETKEWRTKALELVSRVFPQRAEHENRHTCATYLPHALVLKVLGPDHPDTLESVSELASVLQSQGKYEQAEQMNRRALEGREKALGPDHPDTLNSVNNWASVLQNQGKYEQAEQMNRRALEAKEKVLGPDHPDTLTSMANLASTYRNQGRSKEAEVLGVQVMETRKRVLGQDHPSTLTSMANLASTYRNQGRSKEAEVLEVQVAVNGRKERIVRLLLDSGVDSTKLKDKEQILASILHETNSDVESDSDAESLLSCGSIFSDQSSLSSQSSISPNIPSEARAQAEDIVACTLGINDEISQVVSKAGQKWSEDKIDRQMSRAIKEFSGHLASHAVEGSPVLERIPVLLRLRALPIARKIRALSDYNFEPVVVSPVNERALYKYLQENTDTREIFQPENILRFLDDDVRSTYVDERDLQTGLETEEVLSDTSNQSDGEEDFELQQSSEVDQGQQSVEQSREFLSRKDIADLFLQAVQRNFLKQKKPKENFKPEIPHGENDNLLEASGQDCPSADNAEETSLVSIPHPCASPPGDLNSSRREWEEEGIPKYTKSESEQISNSDISETARFEKDYQSNTCEINRTQVVGVVNQHNTEEDSPCSQRTSDLFLNDQEVVHAVFIKASFALLLSAFSLVVLGSKVPVSSKAIFYTALAGHALEWKLIMAVIHVSFGDIMVDILDTLSKLLPKSMMWFGRRFRCLHDHCTSENHGRKLSFHNFCELAAHFQQHHMQHSGPYSTNSGSQPILPSDPEQAAPDITITVVPGISQQDRDQSQSTTHQPCRTNDSVPDETHVLDICVPVTDSSSSDIHLLDELQFSTEWKDPVLLGQLKIKFHKKQSYARFLPWRLLHLKRLQRVNIKKYNFHRAINPDTVICLRDPVTAGCEPFHGLDNLLLTEYQEMLAMYVENPACCSKDQEFWVAELGNVKRDRNAQKSERTWYGIRFEEQWSRSCFISLLVLISTFGVAISVVLIRKRSWEAGLGFTGAYFALVAFLFSTLVFMNSRGR